MKKALLHQSGIITLISGGNNIKIALTQANGKVDKVTREIAVGGVTDKEFHEMMKKPKEFNLNRFGKSEIKK